MKRLLLTAALLCSLGLSSRAVELISDTAVWGFATDFLSYRNAMSKGWNFGNTAANAPTVTLLGVTMKGNLGVNDAASGLTFTTAPLTYAIGGFVWTGAPEQAARDAISKGGLHGGTSFFSMKLTAVAGKTYVIDILALDASAPVGGRSMDVLVDGVLAKNDWLIPVGSPYNRVLRLRTVADADGIDLRLDIGGSGGSGNPAISAVALTEEVASPPIISTAPRSQTQPIGGTAMFSVVVSGSGPFTYQWRKNTVNIATATSATLVISPVTASDAANYDVVVTNAQGSVTSSTAVLQTVVPLAPAGSGILQNLAGYWRFDETLGGTAADTSGQHNSGNLTNYSVATNSYWTAGKVGGALRFAAGATNEHVLVPNFPKTTAAYTISAWVWADSRPTWASIVKNWYGEFHFGLESGTGELGNYIGLTSSNPNAKEGGTFPTGSWQHVACTADGTNLRVYRNGLQVASTAYSGALFTPPPQALSIGAKIVGAATDSHWQGLIDDVALWNRSLSASEIYSLFAAGSAGLDITNAAPSAPPTGLVINEYMADNVGGIEDEDRDSSDWIELFNGTASAVNLDGYHLTDVATNLPKWRFPAVTLNAGQHLLVWASGKNRAIAGQPLHTNFQIDPDGEDLALVAPNGTTIVHRYNTPLAFTAGQTFPHFPSETNVSFGLHNTGTQTAFFPVATPGQANVAPVESRGALISQLTHLPLAPAAGQAINVTARIRADQTSATANSITSATLRYRLMYGAEQAVAMHDDGLNGDTLAADGFFTGTIPASLGATAGQMVRWNVTALTSEGRTTRAPRHLVTESPEYEGTVISDPSITSPLPVIHRFVENAAAAELLTGTRCEMFYDGEFYDNCFTRIRGNTSIGWPKKSYKVEFNKGRKFRLRAGQSRVDEFDLNTTYTDKSYVRAQLVSEMYRATGLATPEIFPVHVRQNGVFYSVAHYVEQPDGDFLGRYGLDPDGSYYKAVGDHGACDFTDAAAFDKKTRLDEGYTDLQSLVTAMGLTGTALETWLFDNLDVPQVVNFMAGVAITQNIDASNKNYFMYRDSDGSREWMFIPWDLDLSFGPDALNTDTIVYSQNVPSTPACASHPFLGVRPWQLHGIKYNRLQEAIVANPRTRAMLVRRIRGMNDQFLATNYFQTRMDQLKPVLQTDVDADHAKWGANSHFNWSGGGIYTLTQAMNRIKNEYLTPRVGYLMTTHAAPETLNFTTGLGRAGIPSSQPAAPVITFGDIEANPASGIQDQEYIELRNPGAASVDLSGWTLSGGVTFTFKGGTVMLPGESLFVTPNRYAFRQRTTGPRGAERRLVTGDASGHLSNLGETLTLKNVAGTTIASITLPATPSPAQLYLRITELHYHPPGDGLAEFIELQNTSTTVTLDLTGIHFSDGIEFAFAASTLAPGERIFVVRNTAAFTAAFGTGLRIAGEFQNLTNLSDGGEHVALDDAGNSTIQEVNYDDTAPWPTAADGTGQSLHFILGSTDVPGVSEAVRWFASVPNPGLVPTDTDGDGQSNHAEWLAGTDAANGASFFAIISAVRNGDGSITGIFPGVLGKTYRVSTSPDLATWTPLGAVIAPATTGPQPFTDPSPGTGARFYKVVTPAL